MRDKDRAGGGTEVGTSSLPGIMSKEREPTEGKGLPRDMLH